MLSNDDVNKKIEEYNEKICKYFNNTKNNSYIIELQKCCGYSEFILCFVESTVEELYVNVNHQFQENIETSNIRLYIVIGQEKILVERTTIKLKDFIREYREILNPVYPVPCKVVYKLFIDDGICHEDHSINQNLTQLSDDYKTSMDICKTCIIHK